jgi:hypothetical protein
MPFPWIGGLKVLKFGRSSFIDSPDTYIARQTVFSTPDWQTIHANIQNVQVLTASLSDFLTVSYSWFNPRIQAPSLFGTFVSPFLMNTLRSSGFWYTNLTSLDILALERTMISASVMTELHHLQHLALQGIETPDLIANLQTWTATVLPALRSFKLLSKYLQHSLAQYEALSAFLYAHPHLRRLDLDVIGSWHFISEILLPIFHSGLLDELEVLGLNTGFYMNAAEAFSLLGRSLPSQRLTALRLVFWWAETSLPPSYMGSLVSDLSNITY